MTERIAPHLSHLGASEPGAIASLALAGGQGVLGLTHCPGRCEPGSGEERRRQAVQSDLVSIDHWRAQALVTLMPMDELRRVGAEQLGEETHRLGMAWYHLPIADMEPPDAGFERRWQYAGARLRELLRGGGRVMVHCRAGLGRSGTVAARLLVEMGVPPSEAVAQVRHARPGAIQTAAQENYVIEQRRIGEPGDRLYARRLGCLMGGAVGDAFGHSQLGGRAGGADAGLRQPRLHDGHLAISDDTQISLFTLEGLLRGLRGRRTDEDALLKQMRLSWLDWLQTQGYRHKLVWHASHLLKHASMHVKRQPGLTNLDALLRGAAGSPASPANDSQACGGLQRVAPIGLLPGMTGARAFGLAVRAAATTHGHPNAYLPAGVLAALVTELVHGQGMQAALDATLPLLRTQPGHGDTLAAIGQALDKSGQTHFGRSARGLPPPLTGHGALAVGLYAALVGRDLHEALHLASDPEHGSDSATAVAGQIHGAWHGIQSVPHAWADGLDALDAICDLLHWGGPVLRQRN